MKVAMSHVLQPLPDVRELSLYRPLPAALASLIEGLMAKEQHERPDSVDVVHQVILDVHKSLEARPTSAIHAVEPGARKVSPPVGAQAQAAEPSDLRLAVRERTQQGSSTPATPPHTVSYSAIANTFPMLGDPGVVRPGRKFFAGGPATLASGMSQWIDVSSGAALIDTGAVTYTFSADIGGFASDGDNARAQLTFFNTSGQIVAGRN